MKRNQKIMGDGWSFTGSSSLEVNTVLSYCGFPATYTIEQIRCMGLDRLKRLVANTDLWWKYLCPVEYFELGMDDYSLVRVEADQRGHIRKFIFEEGRLEMCQGTMTHCGDINVWFRYKRPKLYRRVLRVLIPKLAERVLIRDNSAMSSRVVNAVLENGDIKEVFAVDIQPYFRAVAQGKKGCCIAPDGTDRRPDYTYVSGHIRLTDMDGHALPDTIRRQVLRQIKGEKGGFFVYHSFPMS